MAKWLGLSLVILLAAVAAFYLLVLKLQQRAWRRPNRRPHPALRRSRACVAGFPT